MFHLGTPLNSIGDVVKLDLATSPIEKGGARYEKNTRWRNSSKRI